MIKVPTENGEITISDAVFTTITGAAATNCFGVKGMAQRSMTDGLVHLLRPEAMSKGVKVTYNDDGTVSIELHIVVENGVNAGPFRMSGPFRYGQDAITKMADTDGPAFVCPRPMLRPSYVSVESRGKVLTNLQSFRVNGAPTNEDARAESEMIFGAEAGAAFDTPKPERLLERFIAAATEPGDTVLDPFAGSGTTPAVAQKMGRKWIAVELSSDTIRRYIVPRIRGVITGTDPLPLAGRTPSTDPFTFAEPRRAA